MQGTCMFDQVCSFPNKIDKQVTKLTSTHTLVLILASSITETCPSPSLGWAGRQRRTEHVHCGAGLGHPHNKLVFRFHWILLMLLLFKVPVSAAHVFFLCVCVLVPPVARRPQSVVGGNTGCCCSTLALAAPLLGTPTAGTSGLCYTGGNTGHVWGSLCLHFVCHLFIICFLHRINLWLLLSCIHDSRHSEWWLPCIIKVD